MTSQSKKVGYIKAVTKGFEFETQREVLREAGCVVVYRDILSSSKDRGGFKQLLSSLNDGDTVVVHSLDRLGTSVTQLIETIDLIRKKGATLVSLMEAVDSSKLMSLTEWVKLMKKNIEKMHIERTEPARLGAISRGRQGGRPEKMTAAKIKVLQRLYHDQNVSIREICKKFGISRPTVYKYLRA